jgi:hypothetical protein
VGAMTRHEKSGKAGLNQIGWVSEAVEVCELVATNAGSRLRREADCGFNGLFRSG